MEHDVKVRLTRTAIDPAALLAEVAATTNGATVLFTGCVRNFNDDRAVDGIEYSAYDAMAVRSLQQIVDEAAQHFGASDIAVEHRLGELEVGDVSVAIAVAHPHRGAAFEAARYIIEELKKRVPIWKLERYVDGTREWVDQSGRVRTQEVIE
jgi:molybdopterin synthase catalytic subunit